MNFWKRYPADYSKKTSRLTLAQHGAYTLLLDEVYSTEQPLPADLDELYRICRAMTPDEQSAVIVVAERYFPVSGDGLRHNQRAAEELVEAAPAIEAARQNGKLGGRPRKPSDNPVGLQNETQNEPRTKPPHSSESPSLRSGERATRLAKPFDLPSEWRDWAMTERPDLDAEAVARKFADFWHAKPGAGGKKLDWLATWRNWVREERAPRLAPMAGADRKSRQLLSAGLMTGALRAVPQTEIFEADDAPRLIAS